MDIYMLPPPLYTYHICISYICVIVFVHSFFDCNLDSIIYEGRSYKNSQKDFFGGLSMPATVSSWQSVRLGESLWKDMRWTSPTVNAVGPRAPLNLIVYLRNSFIEIDRLWSD